MLGPFSSDAAHVNIVSFPNVMGFLDSIPPSGGICLLSPRRCRSSLVDSVPSGGGFSISAKAIRLDRSVRQKDSIGLRVHSSISANQLSGSCSASRFRKRTNQEYRAGCDSTKDNSPGAADFILLSGPHSVKYIPNCPLQGTGILSGRGSRTRSCGTSTLGETCRGNWAMRGLTGWNARPFQAF